MGNPRNAMEVQAGYRGRAFTSDLSGQEFWLVVDKGFQPMGMVVGNCVYSMGAIRNWSKRGKRAWKAQIEKILALYATRHDHARHSGPKASASNTSR
jgi:hypothetical protein